MTGYTVHTGTSLRFSEGWDRIFEGQKTKKTKKSSNSKGGKKPPKRTPGSAAKSKSRVRRTKK